MTLDYIRERVEVDPATGCWVWSLCVNKVTGYGVTRWEGKARNAHRLAYKLANGDPGPLQVNHCCGNRRCCNPDHLYAGTQKQNIADAIRHGTHSKPPRLRGSENGFSKLTEDEVRDIRRRHAAGEAGRALAREFGVSATSIRRIHRRQAWAWVD